MCGASTASTVCYVTCGGDCLSIVCEEKEIKLHISDEGHAWLRAGGHKHTHIKTHTQSVACDAMMCFSPTATVSCWSSLSSFLVSAFRILSHMLGNFQRRGWLIRVSAADLMRERGFPQVTVQCLWWPLDSLIFSSDSQTWGQNKGENVQA